MKTIADRKESPRRHLSRRALLVTVVGILIAGAIAGCTPHTTPSAESASESPSLEEQTLAATGITVHDFTDNDPGPLTDTYYNRNILNAGSRGCSSCHESLYDTLQNITIGDKPHIIGPPANGRSYEYRECSPACHMGMGVPGTAPALEDAIHSIHFSSEAFTEGGGICESCHAYNAEGDLVLWDDFKYTAALGGYPNMQNAALQTWNSENRSIQNGNIADIVTVPDVAIDNVALSQPLSADDDIFYAANAGAYEIDMTNYSVQVTGVKGKSNWTIDEIRALPATEKIITQDCAGNGPNGCLISNFSVRGVTLADFIDACGGLEDGMQSVIAVPGDNFSFGMTLDVGVVLDQETLLGYEINGHDLTAAQGYPLTLFVPGFGGNMSTKYVTGLTFSAESATYHDNWIMGANAGNMNAGWLTPNEDGFEARAGEPIDLAGWAYVHTGGGEHEITGIAITADYGDTWTTLDVSDQDIDPDQWVQFSATFTPEKPGTYVLKVKALDNTGATFTNAYTGEEGAAPVIIKVTE